jgi:hypothetical protein
LQEQEVADVSGAMWSVDHEYGREMLRQNVEALSRMAAERFDQGWRADLVTMKFSHIPGNREHKILSMLDETERLYKTLVTHVERRPRSLGAFESLPVMIAAPDLQVAKDRQRCPVEPKRRRSWIEPNGGLHVHAVLLICPCSRLRVSVREHFAKKRKSYLRYEDFQVMSASRPVRRWPLQDIHVEPVESSPGQVVDYILKTVLRRALSYDHVRLFH